MSKKSKLDHILNSKAWQQYRGQNNWQSEFKKLPFFSKQLIYSRKMPLVGDVRVIAAQEQVLKIRDIDDFTEQITADMTGAVLKVWFTQDFNQRIAAHLIKEGWVACTHPVSTVSEVKIDLTKGIKNLYDSLGKKTRYEIRRTEKSEVEITFSDGNEEDFKDLAKLIEATKQRTGSGVRSLEKMREAWDLFKKQGQLKIWKASYKGEALSIATIVETENTVYYRDGGSIRHSNKFNASTLLHWKIIEHYAEQGRRKIYNMMGVTPKNYREAKKPHTLDGVTKFKQTFNPEISDSLGVFEYPLDENLYSRFKKVEPWVLRFESRINKEYWY